MIKNKIDIMVDIKIMPLFLEPVDKYTELQTKVKLDQIGREWAKTIQDVITHKERE